QDALSSMPTAKTPARHTPVANRRISATVTASANQATENVHTAARTALSPSRMLGRTRSDRLRIVAVNAPTTKPIWTVPVSHTVVVSFSIKSCCMMGTTEETENQSDRERHCIRADRAHWED